MRAAYALTAALAFLAGWMRWQAGNPQAIEVVLLVAAPLTIALVRQLRLSPALGAQVLVLGVLWLCAFDGQARPGHKLDPTVLYWIAAITRRLTGGVALALYGAWAFGRGDRAVGALAGGLGAGLVIASTWTLRLLQRGFLDSPMQTLETAVLASVVTVAACIPVAAALLGLGLIRGTDE